MKVTLPDIAGPDRAGASTTKSIDACCIEAMAAVFRQACTPIRWQKGAAEVPSSHAHRPRNSHHSGRTRTSSAVGDQQLNQEFDAVASRQKIDERSLDAMGMVKAVDSGWAEAQYQAAVRRAEHIDRRDVGLRQCQ
jgi:hypothetical protein